MTIKVLKYVVSLLMLLAPAELVAQNVETQRHALQRADSLQAGEPRDAAICLGGNVEVDSMETYALPVLDFSAPGFNGLSPWNYGLSPVWQMHRGFNAQLGMGVTVGFGKEAPHGAGFSQQAAFGYAMPLSKRFAVAVGVYANNLDWGAFSQREAGVAAAVKYQVNDAVNVYAYGAKSFFPDSRNRMFRLDCPLGYGTAGLAPGYYWTGIPSERVGAMAEIKLGKNAMIQVSVEHQKY